MAKSGVLFFLIGQSICGASLLSILSPFNPSSLPFLVTTSHFSRSLFNSFFLLSPYMLCLHTFNLFNTVPFSVDTHVDLVGTVHVTFFLSYSYTHLLERNSFSFSIGILFALWVVGFGEKNYIWSFFFFTISFCFFSFALFFFF